MLRVRISPRALEDLIEIGSYIPEDSLDKAEAYADKLLQAAIILGRQPRSGRRREELAPGLQSFAFGSYVVFSKTRSGC
jgi:toxin ParE1/3/4